VSHGIASFTLYVAGNSDASRGQRDRLTASFARLGVGIDLEVVDVLEDPARAESDRVMSTPMLVRWKPGPVYRLVGDVTDADIDSLLDNPIDAAPYEETRPVSPDRSSEILSRASHELRTPLAVIRGFAATLQDSVNRMDREMSTKAADAIVRSSIQLQAMLESMLVVEAVETDGLKLQLSDWELGDIALETIRDLQPLLSRHVIQTSIRDGVWVRVDAAKIRQVITNLMTNAVKFSESGTRVTVTVSGSDGVGVVKVEDQGQGIPYEYLGKLFGKYERLGRGEKGTGLGLYIALGLARAHRGDIKVFSDGETGSRFELSIPLLRS
jgi:signal transduction histidine kinase